MLLNCMAGLCSNTGVLLGDKGLQLPASLGGSFGSGSCCFPSSPGNISCTSHTLGQGAGPCQGEGIWGSLSCTRWSQGFAGSQGSGTGGPCHTEMPPNAATSRHPVSPSAQDWGSGNEGLPEVLELGLAPTAAMGREVGRCGQPCAAFLGAWLPVAACPAAWVRGCGQQEVSPESISVSLGCDPWKLAASVPFPLEMLLSSCSIFGVILESQHPWKTQGAAKLGALTQLKTEQGRSPALRSGLFHLSGAAEQA